MNTQELTEAEKHQLRVMIPLQGKGVSTNEIMAFVTLIKQTSYEAGMVEMAKELTEKISDKLANIPTPPVNPSECDKKYFQIAQVSMEYVLDLLSQPPANEK